MRFAADSMLGRLATWLRFLGYDTLYSNDTRDDQFFSLADRGRILLSRNTKLREKIASEKYVFIEDDDPERQLLQVVRLLGLNPGPEKFFTRCTLCNGMIESVESADVFGDVPDHVWTSHKRFSRCDRCGKIYWPGSHLGRARKEIERLLAMVTD